MEGPWSTVDGTLQMVSMLSPVILASFLLLLSLFNQNIKGLVYLGGLLMSLAAAVPLRNMIQHPVSLKASPLCSLGPLEGVTGYDVPPLSSVAISFTFMYLFLPMKSSHQMNYGLITGLAALFATDAFTKVRFECTPPLGPLVGAGFGAASALLWYTAFHASGYPSLLYFDEVGSNRVFCKKPSKQSFKCQVYKNGELVAAGA